MSNLRQKHNMNCSDGTCICSGVGRGFSRHKERPNVRREIESGLVEWRSDNDPEPIDVKPEPLGDYLDHAVAAYLNA